MGDIGDHQRTGIAVPAPAPVPQPQPIPVAPVPAKQAAGIRDALGPRRRAVMH